MAAPCSFVATGTILEIDRAYRGIDYDNGDFATWQTKYQEEAAPKRPRRKPILVWEREIEDRDMITGNSISSTDMLALVKARGKGLIMERWVILEYDDADGTEIASFALNMYDRELQVYDPDPNIRDHVEQFTSLFRRLVDYE